MAIRPKKGDRVRFTSWYGENSPDVEKWTGVVEEVVLMRLGPRNYRIRRDFDGKITVLQSRSLKGYAKGAADNAKGN